MARYLVYMWMLSIIVLCNGFEPSSNFCSGIILSVPMDSQKYLLTDLLNPVDSVRISRIHLW